MLLSVFLALIWFDGGFMPVRAINGATVFVVDGDSLRIDGEDIRLTGYDAPEFSQICNSDLGLPWSCGLAARSKLIELTAAGGLECVSRGQDVYGRTLARCRTAQGDIGAAMVRAGLGLRSRYTPFRYHAEETEARQAGRGVWQGRHEKPEEHRRGKK